MKPASPVHHLSLAALPLENMIIFQFYLLFFTTVLLNFSKAHNSLQKLGKDDVLISYTILGDDAASRDQIAVVNMNLAYDVYPWAHLVGKEFLKRPVHVTSARIHFNMKDAKCVLADAGHKHSKIFTTESPLEFPADHVFGDASWTTTYFHCFTEPEQRPDLRIEEEYRI